MLRLAALGCVIVAWLPTCASQMPPAGVRALASAIRQGDKKGVEDQLLKGVPVNAEMGLDTPLTLAIAAEKPDIVYSLLLHGAQRTLPYAGTQFSRSAVPKGQKLWKECESCHRLETNGVRPGPRLDDLPSRTMTNRKAPSFDNIVDLVTNGSGSMPAFRDRMSRADINAVVSYFVASVDPDAGLTPYDLALVGCNRQILSMLNPVPHLLESTPEPRITTYAESMAQIVRLQQGLCLAGSRFANQPNLGSEIEKSRTSVAWLLSRWRQFARTTWQASNYDFVWPARATALERLKPGDARAAQVLAGLRRDLDLAVDDCLNSPQGMGTVRTVKIQTMRDGVPESGWQVFFKFRILESFPDVPGQPFPNLSSPSTWKLPPGNYLIYAQKRKQASPPMAITVDHRVADGTQWQIPLP